MYSNEITALIKTHEEFIIPFSAKYEVAPQLALSTVTFGLAEEILEYLDAVYDGDIASARYELGDIISYFILVYSYSGITINEIMDDRYNLSYVPVHTLRTTAKKFFGVIKRIYRGDYVKSEKYWKTEFISVAKHLLNSLIQEALIYITVQDLDSPSIVNSVTPVEAFSRILDLNKSKLSGRKELRGEGEHR